MYFKFESLVLQARKERIMIDLSHQISFFHGQIGSGKSSIVRLIDFMIGGNLEFTPAIQQELVSSTMNLRIGNNDVILERKLDSSSIQVTWENEAKERATVSAPLRLADAAIWNDNVFNFNDLVFYLLGMNTPMALKSKINEDTTQIRVGLRDFMWYCYLDQDHLDSSFFRLEDTFKRNKSRDVMKYVLGFHSDTLTLLERDLLNAKEEKNNAISNIKSLKNLLTKFNFETADEIESDINAARESLTDLKLRKERLESTYSSETHIVDELRVGARKNSRNLENSKNALYDLEQRISEQVSLKNELLSSKFKLARSLSVANVLDNVKFDLCPSCGSNIEGRRIEPETCYLCCSDISSDMNDRTNVENLKIDLDSRILELENSISIHKKELARQKRLIKKQENFRRNIDSRIDQELKNYDSRYLSLFREIDRKIATMEERIKGYLRLKAIPDEIESIEKKFLKIELREQKAKEKISLERSKLTTAKKMVRELEAQFKDTLEIIGFPGINEKDKVSINTSTWNVYVLPKGQDALKWSYENAGSGGKKTLFNVAYLLSLHIVASNNDLPLPNFVIIDTPMKNIGEDVNQAIFDNFYKFLYDISLDELKDTQFIIIDKDFVLPEFEVDMSERYMTPDDPENPPLITYYEGP
ncbi:AAA family ATPase [Flagellimonas algicola]|uniref:AAA domain-containing protein n=1 Tax=Flagellimonas algicola TaxID=2583815 RepID=A0ABY2WRS9_9FLAO|nr:AAA family ATPase [Allomuricauda algicola]TMU57445.1 hypothetical protein FGG15_07850 [Allomuricauda algicola]